MVGAFASISQFPVAPDINNNTTSQVQTNLLQKLFDINLKSYHAFLLHRHILSLHSSKESTMFDNSRIPHGKDTCLLSTKVNQVRAL